MPKAKNKTVPTTASVDDFIAGVADEARARDCRELVRLMRTATGETPRMWGPGIVGFGEYHYKYDSGREGDSFIIGFSPRKSELALYFVNGFATSADLLARLGRHKTGKSCLYVKRLDDLDRGALTELIERSVKHMTRKYAASRPTSGGRGTE